MLFRSALSPRCCGLIIAALAGQVACYHGLDEGSSDTDSGAICDESSGSVYGNQAAWDTAPEDWSDVNEPGIEPVDPSEDPNLPIVAGTGPLAVHAAHLETKRIMMYHGHQDQFIWKIKDLTRPAGEGLQMDWHPMAIQATWPRLFSGNCDTVAPVYSSLACDGGGATCLDDGDCGSGESCVARTPAYPDLFCTGHAQMWDGRVFFAGGDVNGGPCGGGLKFAWIYDPRASSYNHVADYGWIQLPDMLVDRWYPSVTALPSGELLVTSGNSQDPNIDGDTSDGGATTLIIELFDPFDPLGYGWQRTCSADHGIVDPAEPCQDDGDCGGGERCNSVVPNFPNPRLAELPPHRGNPRRERLVCGRGDDRVERRRERPGARPAGRL